MNGERGPEAKLGLREVERAADEGEDEERDGIEDEDGTHGDGGGFFAGVGDGGERGNGAATADGGSRGDEEALGFADVQEVREACADEHGEGDAERGVEESGAADADDLAEVHAESETDDGGLEKEFREAARFEVISMLDRQAVGEAGGESQGRGENAGGGEDDPQEEEILRHCLRMTGWGEVGQTDFRMGDKQNLSELGVGSRVSARRVELRRG